jgi:hypothetical protein
MEFVKGRSAACVYLGYAVDVVLNVSGGHQVPDGWIVCAFPFRQPGVAWEMKRISFDEALEHLANAVVLPQASVDDLGFNF